MHVISKRMFVEAAALYPNDRISIMELYSDLKKGEFENPEEMKNMFASLDNFKNVDKWYVIDIGGGNLRLIAYINFVTQRLNSKYIVPHAEYDKLSEKAKRGQLRS